MCFRARITGPRYWLIQPPPQIASIAWWFQCNPDLPPSAREDRSSSVRHWDAECGHGDVTSLLWAVSAISVDRAANALIGGEFAERSHSPRSAALPLVVLST